MVFSEVCTAVTSEQSSRGFKSFMNSLFLWPWNNNIWVNSTDMLGNISPNERMLGIWRCSNWYSTQAAFKVMEERQEQPATFADLIMFGTSNSASLVRGASFVALGTVVEHGSILWAPFLRRTDSNEIELSFGIATSQATWTSNYLILARKKKYVDS